MDNLYLIKNNGCDDTTHGLADIPESIFPWFKELIGNLNKNSTYGCQPTINIFKLDAEDIRESTDEDEKDNLLYFGSKTYVLSDEWYRKGFEELQNRKVQIL